MDTSQVGTLSDQKWRKEVKDVRGNYIMELTQAIEMKMYAAFAAARHAENKIWERATDMYDYKKKMDNVLEIMQLFPDFLQNTTSLNYLSSHQYRMDQGQGAGNATGAQQQHVMNPSLKTQTLEGLVAPVNFTDDLPDNIHQEVMNKSLETQTLKGLVAEVGKMSAAPVDLTYDPSENIHQEVMNQSLKTQTIEGLVEVGKTSAAPVDLTDDLPDNINQEKADASPKHQPIIKHHYKRRNKSANKNKTHRRNK